MVPPPPTLLRPQPGPQERFAQSNADIAIFGGAAGGGKSYALRIEPLYHVHVPRFTAVILRESFTQVAAPGGLWDTSCARYPLTGATMHKSDMAWTWPSGAKVKFAHLANDDAVHAWQGSQVTMIGWDELTHHAIYQFFSMLSRNRSVCGVRPSIQGTCNPDADSWVANVIRWWLNPLTGYPLWERSGAKQYFLRVNDEITWVPKDTRDRLGLPARSVTFIPSRVSDNHILLATNPAYVANVLSLPTVERERRLEGNWKIRRGAGKVFNRFNFPLRAAAPAGGQIVRCWDFAATEQALRGNDPDATAAVKLQRKDGVFTILDCLAVHVGPAELDRIFTNTTAQDVQAARDQGASYAVRWEIEPGSAGKRERYRLVKQLAGLDAAGVSPQGDNVTRAIPFAKQVAANNVLLVGAEWNEAYLTELHMFPAGGHDDRVDASSEAFNAFIAGSSHTVKQYDGRTEDRARHVARARNAIRFYPFRCLPYARAIDSKVSFRVMKASRRNARAEATTIS